MRIEQRLLKVLKALAEYLDVSLGELVEGIVLHAFEGKQPFRGDTVAAIDQLRNVYGLTLAAADSHLLAEPRRTAGADDPGRASAGTRTGATS
jgi:hypothetical protein